MTAPRTLLSLAEDYLAERRGLGFDLRIPGGQITAFARFVDATVPYWSPTGCHSPKKVKKIKGRVSHVWGVGHL
jgi:hypothetical protein